jgi:hypothetical protein
MVTTWNTHKTETGFEYRVYTVGYQVPSETLKAGLCATRAQAVSKAKAWTRYFKAIQRKAA